MLFSNVMRLRSFSVPGCAYYLIIFRFGTACPAGQVEPNEAECLTFVATVARVWPLIRDPNKVLLSNRESYPDLTSSSATQFLETHRREL